MTKKIRIVLFLVCLFLFLLIAPLTILYFQGYRFDFENKRLTQTGGFFLKVIPKQAEIYIDGKLIKKTDFFFGSVLIKNLLPGKHKIEVKKEGYFNWEKNLEIKEKEVTEAKDIVLFPKNLNFNILTGGVKDFLPSPDGKKIILYEVGGPAENGLPGWALKLYNLEKNVKSHLISEKEIYSKGADLLNLEFSKDSKEIYLDVGMAEKKKNFVLSLEKLPPVLVEKENRPTPENIVASQILNGDNYYLDNFGNFFKNQEKLTEKSFPIKAETEYALEFFQDFKFLREGNVLYYFDPDSKSFEKFFENLNSLKISPDLRKLVYFSDYEIWVLFLEDSELHQKRDQVFLVRLSEKIENVFWLNSDYLIFNTKNKIKIAEIDDRDRIQIWEVVQMASSKIYFNQRDRKLYLLKEGGLYSSEPLIQ